MVKIPVVPVNLRKEYQYLWDTMDITPSRKSLFVATAKRIIAYKDTYLKLEEITNVPWYVIGILHLRESNLNFKKHLHNGDSLLSRTVRVPANRPINGHGPFTFEESAIDALKMKMLHKITEWDIPQIAYVSELYNGMGYRNKKINSPYLWAGTDNYVKGKYIRDHVFDRNVVDKQLGCMGTLKCIFDLEKIDQPTKEEIEDQIAILAPKAEPMENIPKVLSQTSRKWNLISWLKTTFGIGGAGTVAFSSADIESTKPILDTLKEYGPEIIVVVCVVVMCVLALVQHFIKQDVEEGKYIITPGEDE